MRASSLLDDVSIALAQGVDLADDLFPLGFVCHLEATLSVSPLREEFLSELSVWHGDRPASTAEREGHHGTATLQERSIRSRGRLTLDRAWPYNRRPCPGMAEAPTS
jgi:hypothetical protein